MAEDLLKNKTRSGLYWSTLNQFSGYGVQFFIGVIMARLLSPEDYGISALPAVFLAIAGVFIDSGFYSAMVRKPRLTEQDISTSFFYSLGIGTVCYLLIFLSSPWIAKFYNVPILESLIRWSALSFLINPLTTPQMILLNRRLDFKTPTIISFISRIVMGICGITIAYNGYGVWALVYSSLVSSVFNFILSAIFVRWYPKTGWSKDSFNYLWGYGNKLVASYLIGNVYENIVPVIIGKFYSPATLGIYNRAQQYSKLVSSSTTNVFQQVSFPVLSKLQDNEEDLIKGYRKLIKASAFVTFPLMMLLAAIAKPLIIFMLTEKWEGCVLYLQLMCFPMMWYPVHAINLNILQVVGRTDMFFKIEIYKKVFGIVAMMISLPLGLVAYILSTWITNFTSLYLNTYCTKKMYNYGMWNQIRDILPSLLLSVFMLGTILLVTFFIESYLCQVIIGSIVGIIVYGVGSVIFRFPEVNDLKYMLNIK